MRLTQEEYSTLAHVLHATGIESWFAIKRGFRNHETFDYCYDLDNKNRITMKEGLIQAMDGFIELDSLGIRPEEKLILGNLLNRLKIVGIGKGYKTDRLPWEVHPYRI